MTFLYRSLQSLVCRTREVLVRLGLAEFDPCVNLIFPAVLSINGLHVSIQIGEVSLRKKKNPAFTKSFSICSLVSLTSLPKKGR